ncbi:MAG TPA: 23S rRNA (adenine(2503)-C(2))-methyltransferase RlmN [bacterium]|nr:23S rRNA (adenine(2503)-C(2))-methyltransferase RlmN [bacterium]
MLSGRIEKQNLKGLNLEELSEIIKNYAPEKYRSVQIFKWLYRTRIKEIDEMTDISKKLREELKKNFFIDKLNLQEIFVDNDDNTRKLLFNLNDGNKIETVIIPDKERNTLCVSSQVGCRLNCQFCATGSKVKWQRNLTSFEIIDQILTAMDILEIENKRLTNIVFMGMGEPFENIDNVLKSCDIISSDYSIGMAANRITISTAGLPDGIRKLADYPKRYELAVSLNATTDELRNKLMPINKKYNLQTLIESLKYYSLKKPKNQITFEYVLLKDVNDTDDDLIGLRDFCKNFKEPKINLILHNYFDDCKYQQSTTERLNYFFNKLNYYGVRALIRRSRGRNIFAACGQLAARQRANNILYNKDAKCQKKIKNKLQKL